VGRHHPPEENQPPRDLGTPSRDNARSLQAFPQVSSRAIWLRQPSNDPIARARVRAAQAKRERPPVQEIDGLPEKTHRVRAWLGFKA